MLRWRSPPHNRIHAKAEFEPGREVFDLTMAVKPTVLITGVSGNLGSRLVQQLPEYQIIGTDIREPVSALFRFETIDLGEERSCDQLLELMRAYRPEAVVHLAFILD